MSPRKSASKKQRIDPSSNEGLQPLNMDDLDDVSLTDDNMTDDNISMRLLHRLLVDVRQSQQDNGRVVREIVHDELDSLKKDFSDQLCKLETNLRKEFTEELRKKDDKIEDLQRKMSELSSNDSKIEQLERKLENAGLREEGEFPIDKTMVILKLPYSPDENVSQKVNDLSVEMKVNEQVNEQMDIVRMARLPLVGNQTNPLV